MLVALVQPGVSSGGARWDRFRMEDMWSVYNIKLEGPMNKLTEMELRELEAENSVVYLCRDCPKYYTRYRSFAGHCQKVHKCVKRPHLHRCCDVIRSGLAVIRRDEDSPSRVTDVQVSQQALSQ